MVREKTGACVLFVHHSGKDAAKGARGHSLLRAAVDTEIEVRADEATGARTATVVKQRELAKGAAFGFRLDPIVLGQNQYDEDVTTCTVAAGAAADSPRHSGPKLTTDERGWHADIESFFAEPGQAREGVCPLPGMSPVRVATREQLRVWLQHRGRIGVAPGVALTATDRSRLMRYLNRLKDKGKLCIAGDWVWLP